MTSFERVKLALEHKEADKIPFDLGGSVLTGINKVAYQNLRQYLGLPFKELEIIDRAQQLARVHKDVLDLLKVDVACVDPGAPKISPLSSGVVQEGDYLSYTDEYGITWQMPDKGGLYYDMRKHPLDGIDTIEGLKKFKWPNMLDEGRFETMKQRADHCTQIEKKAYILGRHSAGIWEMALWMRGFEKLFMDMALNPLYVETLMDKILQQKMEYWGKALDTVGNNVLIVSEADDIATQQNLMVSEAMYKKFVHPMHKTLFDFIKKRAQNKVYLFYHSCGAVKKMIPYLIEEGVDILNPVQVNAANMDTKDLKREFGNDITFWGGGVDTQHVLPYGSVQDVIDETKRRIEDLGPNGGFIFTPVHNVQGDVKPKNFMAMWETLQQYGVYK